MAAPLQPSMPTCSTLNGMRVHDATWRCRAQLRKPRSLPTALAFLIRAWFIFLLVPSERREVHKSDSVGIREQEEVIIDTYIRSKTH